MVVDKDNEENLTEQKTENRDLTIKERKFVKAVIETGNGTEAAKIAKYKGNRVTLSAVASENLQKPPIMSAVLAAQEKAGITDDLLAKVLKDGLKSNLTKFFQKDGKVIEQKRCKDMPTRGRYLDTAHKLRGEFAPDESRVNIESEDIKSLTDSMRAIAEGRNAVPAPKPHKEGKEGEERFKEEVISLPPPSKIDTDTENLRKIAAEEHSPEPGPEEEPEPEQKEEVGEEVKEIKMISQTDAIADAEKARIARESRK